MTYDKQEGLTYYEIEKYIEPLLKFDGLKEERKPYEQVMTYIGNPILWFIRLKLRQIASLKKENSEIETNYRHYKSRYEELVQKLNNAVPPQA